MGCVSAQQSTAHTSQQWHCNVPLHSSPLPAQVKPHCSLPCLLPSLLAFICNFSWRAALWSFSHSPWAQRWWEKESCKLGSIISGWCLLQCCLGSTEKPGCEGAKGCCVMDLLVLNKATEHMQKDCKPALPRNISCTPNTALGNQTSKQSNSTNKHPQLASTRKISLANHQSCFKPNTEHVTFEGTLLSTMCGDRDPTAVIQKLLLCFAKWFHSSSEIKPRLFQGWGEHFQWGYRRCAVSPSSFLWVWIVGTGRAGHSLCPARGSSRHNVADLISSGSHCGRDLSSSQGWWGNEITV